MSKSGLLGRCRFGGTLDKSSGASRFRELETFDDEFEFVVLAFFFSNLGNRLLPALFVLLVEAPTPDAAFADGPSPDDVSTPIAALADDPPADGVTMPSGIPGLQFLTVHAGHHFSRPGGGPVEVEGAAVPMA